MKDRELILGLLTGILIVLVFLASAVSELSRKLDAATRLNEDLVRMAKQQTITQVEVIKNLLGQAELTGIRQIERKAEKGWYEALQENVGREVPLSYPNGWADRYFNTLAREGVLQDLAKGGRE